GEPMALKGRMDFKGSRAFRLELDECVGTFSRRQLTEDTGGSIVGFLPASGELAADAAIANGHGAHHDLSQISTKEMFNRPTPFGIDPAFGIAQTGPHFQPGIWDHVTLKLIGL